MLEEKEDLHEGRISAHYRITSINTFYTHYSDIREANEKFTSTTGIGELGNV